MTALHFSNTDFDAEAKTSVCYKSVKFGFSIFNLSQYKFPALSSMTNFMYKLSHHP